MATATKDVVREEVATAFRDFVTAMNALDYTKRSHRAGTYWGEVWERAARLFADYTYNELGGKGVVSPLLARNPEGQQMEAEEDFIASDWPYATKQENEAMKPYFDRLFAAIQEEEGTGVLFRKEEGDLKQTQLDIINANNPMTDDIHTGIRSVDDIKTWDEAVSEARANAEQGGWNELAAYPDITNEMVEDALEKGRITIYSSKPIANGVFVTPSKMQAKDYSGGEEVYSKEVPITNVAWINTDEGQYAEVERERELEDVRFDNVSDMEGDLIEGLRFSKVTDPATLDKLNNSPTIKAYRAMAFIEDENGDVEADLGDGRGMRKGRLYSPMATQERDENGRWRLRQPTEVNAWEQADEHPEKAKLKDGKWVFTLKKPDGSTVDAAYNPYIHTSLIPLNDQFTAAHKRPELVTVEVEVPEFELTSGYKAEKAKDPVGKMPWHSGPVAGQLPEGRKREVILSRYNRPVRVVPNSEVADTIVKAFEGVSHPPFPWNVFTPALREELSKRGIEFSTKAAGTVSEEDQKTYEESLRFSKAYHGTDANFDRFNISYAGSGEGFHAHGFGHYVSFDEKTGRTYALKLGGTDEQNERAAAAIDDQIFRDQLRLRNAKTDMERRYFEDAIAASERHKESLYQSRHLYTVEVPDDNGENYIDESAIPTDAQRRKIAEGLQSIPNSEWTVDEDNAMLFGDDTVRSLAEKISYGDLNGYEMYASIAHGLGSKKAASEFLSSLGFVGIKYNGGVDGPCAVIFSDDDIEITDHLRFSKMISPEQDKEYLAEDKRNDETQKNYAMRFAYNFSNAYNTGASGWEFDDRDNPTHPMGYSPKTKKIHIFVKKPVTSGKEMEMLCFHESLHAWMDKMDASDKGDLIKEYNVAKFLVNKSAKDAAYQNLRKMGYSEEEIPEEFLTYTFSQAMTEGLANNVLRSLPENEKALLNGILNNIDYNVEEETDRRGAEDDSLRGSSSLESGTRPDLRDSVPNTGVQEGTGRTAKELLDSFDRDGFRAVVGEENIPEFYNSIYRALPAEMRKEYVGLAEKEGWNFNKAIEKRLSEIAYDGYENDETGILRMVGGLMRFYSGENLSEEAVRYILWKNGQPDDSMTRVSSIALRRRWDADKEEGLLFSKGELSESLNNADAAAEATVDAAKDMRDARRKQLGDNLRIIARAMNIQKDYDRGTVDAITNLAKTLLKEQFIDALSRREVARLLGIVRTSVGKSPKTVKKNADALVEIVIDHLLKREKDGLDALTRRTGTKVNQTGVEVQGELDVQGQKTLKAYKEGLKMDLGTPEDDETKATLYGRRQKLQDRLESKDDASRREAEAVDAGLALAIDYKENITDKIDEINTKDDDIKDFEIAYKDGKISKEACDQGIKAIENSVREKRIELIQSYSDFRSKMRDMISGSVEGRKAFVEREKERVNEIHHLANSDMQGTPASIDRKDRFIDEMANWSTARFLLGSLPTFDQMLRRFGFKNVNGEGYLWNRFTNQWRKAVENAFLGQKAAKDELDRKVSEVFGKEMRWSDLDSEEAKMPRATISWRDADGTMKEHELTQGRLLYIYMVNKMSDGRMKLRRMGITQDNVDAIVAQMDERFIKLADWLQNEYLVNLRNKYNAVHERLFGASMAAIDDYFPLKVNKSDLNRNEDLSKGEDEELLPSSITGSIIKRKRNNKALDLLNADAFSVVIEHIDQMEQWAAFAEFNKDISALLSYKRFRNQVQNMTTVYGSGEKLWKMFFRVCRITGNTYRPNSAEIDKAIVNIAKGVTGAKISFRVFTALKQFLSMPAFVADANPVYLAKSIATPAASWKWAMENLPMFEKRWKSRIAGDTRLMETELDAGFFKSQAYEKLSKYGMMANAFVDALTVSIGSHSIYQTKYDKYIKEGFSEEVADEKAKHDATMLYNETQQSNEGAFLSPVQLDRTVGATMFTVFRNSSMGYQRQLHDAIRNLVKMMKPGYKAESIAFTTKQLIREGLTEEQAEDAAKNRYEGAIGKNAVRVATFGFLVQFTWNLGSSIVYLLFGDDDDEKKEMLGEAYRHAMFGSIEGLVGGSIMSEALNMIAKGESLRNYDPTLLPLASDIKKLISMYSYDKVAAANELLNIASQAITGVNLQTLTDTAVAVVDACNGNMETSKEAMLLIMRVLQVPQSQLDKIYIDELGTDAAGARKMSYSEMAKRYAEYKINREAPLTGWAYSDEERKKKIKSKEKTFKNKVKERKELKKQ